MDKVPDELAMGHLIDGKVEHQGELSRSDYARRTDKLLYTRSKMEHGLSKEMGRADYYVQPDYFKLMDGFIKWLMMSL